MDPLLFTPGIRLADCASLLRIINAATDADGSLAPYYPNTLIGYLAECILSDLDASNDPAAWRDIAEEYLTTLSAHTEAAHYERLRFMTVLGEDKFDTAVQAFRDSYDWVGFMDFRREGGAWANQGRFDPMAIAAII